MKDKIEYLGYFKYEGAPVAYSYLGAGTFADALICVDEVMKYFYCHNLSRL